MKTKFKILSFVALFFIASVISVSTASAGIDIYPMATEDVYDANGGVHYALVYDIEPDHFINGYQPKIYGVGSNTKGAMWFLNQKEHLNEQTWDFVRFCCKKSGYFTKPVKNITNGIFICHKQVNNDTKSNSYNLKRQ